MALHSWSKDLEFYNRKRVLVTGHTGFKGSWLALWLHTLGAEVIGISIDEGAAEGIFQLARLKEKIVHQVADVRDFTALSEIMHRYQPEIVFHLAAQALVMKSYEDPRTTWETNILGTVNVLECLRHAPFVKSAVIITSDKCYKNKEQEQSKEQSTDAITRILGRGGYQETDELGGLDPYSASKSCAELVVASYAASFLNGIVPLASTRAGNVIGGGDWAQDRIIPDAIKALLAQKPIPVRNPTFIRPWQHVLEPLAGYLVLGSRLYHDRRLAGAWNFGPLPPSLVEVQTIVEKLVALWGSGQWETKQDRQELMETKVLYLNSSKARQQLGWSSWLDLDTALKLTAEWYKQYSSEDVYTLCQKQIDFYRLFKPFNSGLARDNDHEQGGVE